MLRAVRTRIDRSDTLIIDDEHDAPARLPQKQGLCQVGKVPDFETLSDF
jgi:hypothetical protein